MPFWIQGWMEVTTGASDSEEALWFAVVDLSVLIDVGDEVSEQLFGLSKAYRRNSELRRKSLFAERGMPLSVSRTVQESIQRIKSHEQQFGKGDFGGFTFATLEEFCQAGLDFQKHSKSDWHLVFQIANALENSGRYDRDKIRFVVWFNW